MEYFIRLKFEYNSAAKAQIGSIIYSFYAVCYNLCINQLKIRAYFFIFFYIFYISPLAFFLIFIIDL